MVVDIDAFTVQNLFEVNRGIPPDQTFAIINVGASLASINIVSRGASAFTRDIGNGGNYITEQIQRKLGISFEQAEEFKMRQRDLGAGRRARAGHRDHRAGVRLDRRARSSARSTSSWPRAVRATCTAST